MADKQDRLAFRLEFLELFIAFGLEKNIPDRKSLINDQNFRINIDGNRKSKTDKHTGRIGFYRLIDKIADIRKIQNILQAGVNLLFGKPVHRSVQIDIFHTGIFTVKSGAKFQQSRNPAVDVYLSLRRI